MCQGERCTNPVPCGRCERGRDDARVAAAPPAAARESRELLQLATLQRRQTHAVAAPADDGANHARR
jgi:hypothetical protein